MLGQAVAEGKCKNLKQIQGKIFLSKKEDEVPFELRLKLSDTDGSLKFPIILIGGEYLGGLKELKEVLDSPAIRPSIRSMFSPSSEIVVFEEDMSQEDNTGVTEYEDKSSSLGSVVLVAMASAISN